MSLENAKRIHLEKDLIVYKVAELEDGIIKPIFGFGKFNFNKINVAEIFHKNGGEKITIDKHSFIKKSGLTKKLAILDGMFHSFKTKEDCKKFFIDFFDYMAIFPSSQNIEMVECIIPKNAIVFEGDFYYYNGKEIHVKSYASNKIIYKRIIK